jgi:hypothetical protein
MSLRAAALVLRRRKNPTSIEGFASGKEQERPHKDIFSLRGKVLMFTNPYIPGPDLFLSIDSAKSMGYNPPNWFRQEDL